MHSNDAEVVCRWLCKSIMETQQQSGKAHLPKLLYGYLHHVSRANSAVFNKKDVCSANLHKTLDFMFSSCSLHSQGIGQKHCLLLLCHWQMNKYYLIKYYNPTNLQNMVFFCIRINCFLCGDQEQRNEQFTQFPKDMSEQNSFTSLQSSF